MKRTLLRIVFILSISFNAAFVLHLVKMNAESQPASEASQQTGSTIVSMNLGLTPSQMEKIRPVQNAMRKQNDRIKNEINGCRGKLLNALKQQEIDRSAVNAYIDQLSGLQNQLQKNTVEEIIQVREYMNDFQCNCLIGCLEASMDGKGGQCTGSCCNPDKNDKKMIH